MYMAPYRTSANLRQRREEKVTETKKGDDGVLPVRLGTLAKYMVPYRTSANLRQRRGRR